MSVTTATFSKIEGDFNDYLGIAVPYLNTTAVLARLNISGANMALLNKLYTNPTAILDQQGWKEIWALHTNPAATNKNITTLLHKLWKQHALTDPAGIENVLRAIYADIPSSVLVPTDYTTLKLTERKPRTAHKVATKNTVLWNSVGIKGGDVHTKCFPGGASILNPSANTQRGTGTKGTRPHKEKGYNIRTLATIVKQGAAIPTLANLPDPNQPLPAGWILLIDTKSTITHHFVA